MRIQRMKHKALLLAAAGLITGVTGCEPRWTYDSATLTHSTATWRGRPIRLTP